MRAQSCAESGPGGGSTGVLSELVAFRKKADFFFPVTQFHTLFWSDRVDAGHVRS